MSTDTTVSRLAEQNMVKARIEAEVAELRAAGVTAEAFDRICAAHPEDAQEIAYRLSATGSAR